MRTTIDRAGRVVVPKELRDRLGLTGGQEVEIIERDGRIEMSVPLVDMHLEPKGKGLVAIPDRALPPLTQDIIRETLERVRR